ncbi:MAG: ATP-binding protein [Anaerolineae bacterium]|nr:putative DNA binding domain-containing protein [Anaerolineae bacterium]MDW8099587.1 ATP-binding protein [Anaerolineae bacterium]
MELQTLFRRGPGPQLAFVPTPDPELLAETMVAFANTDGGTILVGLTPEGRRAENLLSEEVEGGLRQALALCRPPVVTEWEQIEVPGGFVVSIRVPRSTELHALADGRVLVRSGAENRPLSGDAIRQLAATKSSGEFEAEPVPGATRADLDDEIIDEYLTLRAERQRRSITQDREEILRQIAAVTAEGQPTVSGLLLFGREPQVFLPQAGIVFVKFLGKEPRGPGGLPGYGRREEISGPLPRMIERAWRVILEEMRVEAVVRGLKREERTEYPPFAVREALINAVCHRDYRLTGRRIEIRMFDDRLEVQSPGGLPGYITLDNIVEEHFSRNPRIVHGLFQWGFIEELGLGIDRMIEAMVQAGHPQPTFRATPFSFTVILQNVVERVSALAPWEGSMNERQLRALQYIQEQGRITNREYRELCPHVSAETLRLDLADLVDRGILLKVGDKRGTYYILK